jgi:hypothetical protein
MSKYEHSKKNDEASKMDQIESILASYFSYSSNDSMWDMVDHYDQHHEEYFVTNIVESCPPTTFGGLVPEAANDDFY